jgi:hypothetical protein
MLQGLMTHWFWEAAPHLDSDNQITLSGNAKAWGMCVA